MTSSQPDPGFWGGKSVVVTGGGGFLGRVLVGRLEDAGAEVAVVRSAEHDLRDSAAARAALEPAEVVFHLAARVGGIAFQARNPGLVVYENLIMAANVFEACRVLGVGKLVAASSVCVYPKHTATPFSEADVWAGYPEDTNAPYGVAKRMLLVLSDAYRRQYGLNSCAPLVANLYGPGDDFDPENSHVIAAMIRKFTEARDNGDEAVTLWGTGEPSREFLYVDDGARGLILAAERYDSSEPVNLGTGQETRIRDLAELIRDIVGFEGEIVWDTSRPDGQQKRMLDVSRARAAFGFEAEVPLAEGLRNTVEDYRAARARS